SHRHHHRRQTIRSHHHPNAVLRHGIRPLSPRPSFTRPHNHDITPPIELHASSPPSPPPSFTIGERMRERERYREIHDRERDVGTVPDPRQG
ncbi:hypothetical protein A2U01_0078057, partial [Trifolium medium]|nr:hypothetical protein [Trifolium medium]